MATKFTVRKIVIGGALSALSIALVVTGFGFIPFFGLVSFTVMHIPAIIGAILEGPMVGTIVGAIFGVSALIKAATAPLNLYDPTFVNPLISVLPRLFIGVVSWLVYRTFRGRNTTVAVVVAGIAGSLTNTVLVLGSMVIFGAIPFKLAVTITLTNGLLEAAVAAVLTFGVVASWKGIESRSGKARLAKEDK